MKGIYGITEDGCYIVLGDDGVFRKTPPISPLREVRYMKCNHDPQHGQHSLTIYGTNWRGYSKWRCIECDKWVRDPLDKPAHWLKRLTTVRRS